MIIWDEIIKGKKICEDGATKTKKWQYKELKCLVKYMKHENLSNSEIKNSLRQCCQDDIKYLKDRQKNNIFNKLIQQCKDEIIVSNKVITVYTSEIEAIKSVGNINAEKILFAMLVYNKWLDNMAWFSMIKADLAQEAKIHNINTVNQQKIFCEMLQNGMLKSEVKKVLNKHRRKEKDVKKQMWSLTFLQTTGEVAFEFSNYNNFVYRYLGYSYGGYFECKKCEGMFKQNKIGNLEYCTKCSSYKSMKKKIIKCIDCGVEIKVDSKNTKTCRCNVCQKTFRNNYQRKLMKNKRVC